MAAVCSFLEEGLTVVVTSASHGASAVASGRVLVFSSETAALRGHALTMKNLYLKFQLARQSGHCFSTLLSSHLRMQCMCMTWLHWPQIGGLRGSAGGRTRGGHSVFEQPEYRTNRKADWDEAVSYHASPGCLQSGLQVGRGARTRQGNDERT